MHRNSTPRPLARLWTVGEGAIARLEHPQPAAQWFVRCSVASVFFRSGLTRQRDWDTTLALFPEEYHVPLLNPTFAAWLGTSAELALPVLLVSGLGGRFAAAGLFILIVAALSPIDIAAAALQQHVFWGSLLAALQLRGPGRWSLDGVLVPRLRASVFADASMRAADA